MTNDIQFYLIVYETNEKERERERERKLETKGRINFLYLPILDYLFYSI